MKAYISGGAKNGKSTLAQNLAVLCSKYKEVTIGADGLPEGHDLRELELPLYYVATMIPTDEEDRIRIARHIKDREGLGFTTVERGKNINGIVSGEMNCDNAEKDSMCIASACCDSQGVFLLDSVTALLANVMFPPDSEDAWFNPNAPEEVAADLKAFIEKAENVIFVSDYIYGDPVCRSRTEGDEIDYTGTYIRGLACIDRTIASLCDRTYEVAAGIII